MLLQLLHTTLLLFYLYLKEKGARMAAGRPSKFPDNDKEKQALFDKMIALFSEGMSKTEVAVNLNIALSTFYEWEKTYPEFSEAIKEGLAHSQSWWEKIARDNLLNHTGTSFNNTSWIFNMKNRFRQDWSDRTEVEQTVKTLEIPKFEDRQ